MKLFFVAGFLFTVTSYALAAVGIVGLCIPSVPAWLRRLLVVLSITLLAVSTVVAYAYAMELFVAYYGANAYERAAFRARASGWYAWAYWSFIVASLVPQLFWVRRFRNRPLPVLLISLGAVLPSAIERAYAATR